MERENIVVGFDKKGHKVVVINNIMFFGKRKLPWDEVENYLKKYIGQVIEVSETAEEIHIGSDFPDEFIHSQDTMAVRGPNAKAKANLVQGITHMVQIARKTKEVANLKEKNSKKAKQGWNRYLTRFALPVMNQENVIIYYNVYLATLIVRKNSRRQLYLYDIVHVKKEASIEFML